MAAFANNGDSVTISKNIFWAIIVTILLTPIAWLLLKQNATDIVLAKQDIIISNVQDDVKEIKENVKKLLERVPFIIRDSDRGGDDG
ncbi:MAG: hypothetical protein ACXACR_14940 [Candidatus Hodarchaeales archaeon]|jgi:peptidoglycan hydrolase CwlO-like protein